MRIAIVYDCWYPGTYGGAERWLDELAARMASLGHEVTYVTHGFPGQEIVDYKVVALGKPHPLYRDDGVRQIWPSVVFSLRVFRFLASGGASFDLIYVAQSPLWPVLAASLAMIGRRRRLIVEWLEWWPLSYWTSYAGVVTGLLGFVTQWSALVVSPRVVTYTRNTLDRIASHKLASRILLLPGMFPLRLTPSSATVARAATPLVLFVGRLVPDKNPAAALESMAVVQRERPEVEFRMVGDGPMLANLRELADALGLGAGVVLGPVSEDRLAELWTRTAVLLHPSAREGYGLVVVEAYASGTPVVVVDSPDNAAVELVTDNSTGRICASLSPGVVAQAVIDILDDHDSYRQAVRTWYAREFPVRSSNSTAVAILNWVNRA